jgi:fatty acid desaturase
MSTKKLYIDGVWYDTTDFSKKHPGGNVIDYYNNQDASRIYREMHYRSKKANLMLDSLPKIDDNTIPDTVSNKDMLLDFDRWRQSLQKRGFFETDMVHVTYRLIELAGIFYLATWCIGQESYFWNIVSILLYGLFGGRCGWVQHEAGHRSFIGNKYYDDRIQKMTIGFGLLTSGSLWNSMHNKHHAATQKIDHDVDLDTMPFVLFHQDLLKKNRGFSKWWMKNQHWTFLPLTSGVFVMLFWIYYLHPRKILKDRDYEQGLYTLIGHIGRTYIIYKVSDMTILESYLTLMTSMYVSGIYLFGHFSTSHTFMPIVNKTENPNWVEYSINHTVDINTQNSFVCWIMGYLNCQCVHHLFPQMPQYRQPKVSRELAAFTKKWDLKYSNVGYFQAWYYMLSNLQSVGTKVTE